MPTTPQLYDPALDPIGPEEADIAEEIAEAMLSVSRKTFADGGHG